MCAAGAQTGMPLSMGFECPCFDDSTVTVALRDRKAGEYRRENSRHEMNCCQESLCVGRRGTYFQHTRRPPVSTQVCMQRARIVNRHYEVSRVQTWVISMRWN